jgi:hypothetical protein
MAVRVSQDAVEVAYALITYSPTTITGAGVSQDAVEVAYADASVPVRVSQDAVEVAYAYSTAGAGGAVPGTGGGSGSGPTSFGYAT